MLLSLGAGPLVYGQTSPPTAVDTTFEAAFRQCTPFIYEHQVHEHLVLEHQILGWRQDHCSVRTTVIRAQDPELEGLWMTCALNPKHEFRLAFKVASDAPGNPCHCAGGLYDRMERLQPGQQRQPDGPRRKSP